MSNGNGNGNGNNGHNPGTPNVPVQSGSAFDFKDAGLALIPMTPVGFTGRGSAMAWIRLFMYGSLACATWKRNRTISYLSMGAAGLSLTTSLAGGAWNPEGRGPQAKDSSGMTSTGDARGGDFG